MAAPNIEVTLENLSGLIAALSPFVEGVVTAAQVIKALIGVGALTDAQVNADITSTINDAITFKAEADRAAAGLDPQ